MNELRSRWLIATLPLSMALVFCTSTAGSGSTTTTASAASSTAGAGGAGGRASGGGSEDITVAVGTGGDGMDMPVPLADAGLPPDAAVPPPIVACGADAAESCPLPPSYCGDYQWLVFYQNPTCVEGTCQYEAWAKKCDGGKSCVNGGCEYNFTL